MKTDFFDELSDMIVKTAKEFGDRAEQIYDTQKIRSRIASEERVIERMMTDMGKIVYKRHGKGEAMDNEISILCQEIDQHIRRLKELKDEAAGIRGQKICTSCGKSIDKGVSFCPYCGTPCPEPDVQEKTVVNSEEADAEPSEEAQYSEETTEKTKQFSQKKTIQSLQLKKPAAGVKTRKTVGVTAQNALGARQCRNRRWGTQRTRKRTSAAKTKEI